MKVLLISANKLRTPFPVYPIGLDYLAGALKDRHAIRRLDLIDRDPAEVVPLEIADFKPDCIGLSIRNIDNSEGTDSRSYIDEYIELVGTIRAATGVPLMLGGAGFSLFPERLMIELQADYGVIGEGERMANLLDTLEKGLDTSGIPGVISVGYDKERPGPWDGDIRRELPEDDGACRFYIENSGMFNLQTKRGCPFNCIYCTYPVIEGAVIRHADPGQCAEMAYALKEKGAKYIYIADSVFNSDFGHCISIAGEFVKAGLNLPWGGFFSPLKNQPGLFKSLKDAGLTHCEFGTESLSDRMLSAYRKPFCTADVLSAHEEAQRAGVHVCHYFMLGGPGEDLDSVSETLENAERLTSAAFFFFCGVRIYPGTGLYKIAIKEGKITPETDLLRPVFYQSEKAPVQAVEEMIRKKAAGRRNWVIGSGGEEMNRITARLYSRGRIGPLWEKLI